MSLIKSLLTAGCVLFVSSTAAFANPADGVVSAGSAVITESGKKLDVFQSSDKAVIDWRSFNIAADEHTQFHQPSSSSMTLNRVNNGDPSEIMGRLSANGNILIMNPSGVLFGAGSKIDVHGLVATTSNISNDKFMAGGPLQFDLSGKPDAAIINHGTITAADAGLVGLVAPNVINSGLITAKLGKVQLASADAFTLDFYGDGLMNFKVSDQVKQQLVHHSGKIEAAGGTIALTAAAGNNIVNSLINVTGELRAPAVSTKNGKIVIYAEGSNAVKGNVAADKGKKQGASTTTVSGLLDVGGYNPGEKGGSIDVLGDNVGILDGSLIIASGYGGGGNIRIGGDYLGTGDTPAALNTFVDKYTLIYNDGLDKADGGRTIVWSDGNTYFYGNIYGRGGVNGGNGGFTETSGHGFLDAFGYVDLSAPHGNKGTYLLDPTNIAIYGNVDPRFVSSDGTTVNLAPNLKAWFDLSDLTKVTLTYSAVIFNFQTASGAINTNTITTGNDLSPHLAVGARIRLGAAGAVTTADTLGADTYTIAAISGTTITLTSNLTRTYTNEQFFRALVTQVDDISGNAKTATTANASESPLFIANAQNGRSGAYFDGADDSFGTNVASISGSNARSYFMAVNNLQTTGNAIAHLLHGGTQWSAGTTNGLTYVQYGSNTLGNHYWGSGYSTGTSVLANPYLIGYTYSNPNENYLVNGASAGVNNVGVLTTGTGNTYSIMSRVGGGSETAKGNLGEVFIYDAALSDGSLDIVNQYQSLKWGITLNPYGTGATEAAKAMASDGYSAFTTRYLEYLSQSANISLQASNNITFDLKGDTLALASGRDISLTAGNNITSASAGTVTTAGTGSMLFTASNDINFAHDLDLNATGTGNVTLRANNSIVYSGSGDISTQGGTITLNSDRDGNSLGAISLDTGTSLASNNGNITLGGGTDPTTGYAYGTTTNASGIYLNGATVSSGTGTIAMHGNGYAAGSRTNSHGTFIRAASVVQSSSGAISIYGRGGAGTAPGHDAWGNVGVFVVEANTAIQSTTGSITLDGTSGTGNQLWNAGAVIYTGSRITTGGSGNVSITANNITTGAANQDALWLGLGTGGSTYVQTENGDITISATTLRASAESRGVVLLTSTNGLRTTGSGNIQVTGTTASAAADDIAFAPYVFGSNTATGNITLIADRINSTSNPTFRTTGTVTFRPRTASTTVGIGGGAGTLLLPSAVLNNITAGSIVIGRTDGTGAITANANSWTAPVTLQTSTGGININGTQTMGNRTFTARTHGASNITIGASGGVSSTAGGTAITLVSGQNFSNSGGAGALSASNGRWLVYSTDPTADTSGGLLPAFRRYNCTFNGACPAIPGTGNGFLNTAAAGVLTITPNNLAAITAGTAVPSLTNYAYTITGYIGSDAALDSITGALTGLTNYTTSSAAGTYYLNYGSGTLTSSTGYSFTYANNLTALRVNAAPVTTTSTSSSSMPSTVMWTVQNANTASTPKSEPAAQSVTSNASQAIQTSFSQPVDKADKTAPNSVNVINGLLDLSPELVKSFQLDYLAKNGPQ